MKATRYQTDTADPTLFAPGQRWISETQAEFGLALILSCDHTQVKAFFPAVGETLTYAARNAPLRRVAFEPGDTVRDQSGAAFLVADVREEEKRLVYIDGEGRELPESQLSDTMNVQRPEQRLLSGVSDDPRLWALRQSAIRAQHEARASEVRGLVGGRVSLIPHQLFIAEEVANRAAPRVLLADEVGLGKTIEACLILHRLHLCGRASRVLILVPDALVNQWFVELYRRFSLSFAIYDEERALSIEAGAANPGQAPDDASPGKSTNPFFDDQFILCATSWIASHPQRAVQAAEGSWDLVIVDEAHHLEWSLESSSPEYDAVEAIARESSGLLLLTATPEQLGREGHFARLRLLDPARFSDLDEFVRESEKYRAISELADRLRGEEKLKAADLKSIATLLGKETAERLKEDPTPARREAACIALIDLHGPGRVLFRNRRLVLDTFPQRVAHLAPLSCNEEESFKAKLDWLADLLKKHAEEKFLLITHARETVEAIEAGLRERISAQAAVFHEGLSLIQRDKNAAWFADEDGARLLICSEIGSEGRNFQFAHHLVLFDLPGDPGLLEQRIGRLDRIGQTADIHIHVPFVEGTEEELKALWYHRGLAAFEHTLHGAGTIHREFEGEIARLSEADPVDRESALAGFLNKTRAFKKKLDAELESGRDHLLEMSSFDRDQGQALVSQIEDLDEDNRLEQLMLKVFDHFGVTVNDLGDRSYVLTPEHLFSADTFPGLPEEGLSVTFDRDLALAREDLTFLTQDHPLVTGTLESLVSTDHGNAAFFRLENAGEQLLMVETVCVLECIAPERLHAERFLPSKPIRTIVDQKGRNRTADFDLERIRRDGRPGPSTFLREKSRALRATVPPLLEVAQQESEVVAREIREAAIERMNEALGEEIERLERLRGMDHPVREEEITLVAEAQTELARYLAETPLRVDSVRLILAMT
ncbi:MAG: DEAD/DEAH box helicase family protein [Verrucomicrobiae bacterium]|nr:DEAD/DEAH box helicase family protein [Verrucomicrobiae bacterium]